jgi:hypothetical protein
MAFKRRRNRGTFVQSVLDGLAEVGIWGTGI